MAPLIRFVQETGAANGINLLDRWVPQYGSPEFTELFSSYAIERDKAILKVSAMTKAGDKARAIFEKTIGPSDIAEMGGIN